MFLNCTVQLGYISRMVLVMVQMHGLLVNVRLQRVVRGWQRRDLMCRYSSLCHFNHLSFMNTEICLDDRGSFFDAARLRGCPPKMLCTPVPAASSAPSHEPCANL